MHKASQPYLRRTVLPGYAGAILGDERNNSGLRAKASFDGRIVVAQMQVTLDPSVSRVWYPRLRLLSLRRMVA